MDVTRRCRECGRRALAEDVPLCASCWLHERMRALRQQPGANRRAPLRYDTLRREWLEIANSAWENWAPPNARKDVS